MDEEAAEGSSWQASWDELTSFYNNVGHTDRVALVTALQERDEALALSEAAKEIAWRTMDEVDGPLSPDEIKKKRQLLYHQHLPILTDGGIVDVDEDTETVTLTEKGRKLTEAQAEIAE